MKGLENPKTGESSVNEKFVIGQSTPEKGGHVLTITKRDTYSGNSSFSINLYIQDVEQVEPYEWDRTQLVVHYRSICGLISDIRISDEDEYKVDGRAATYEIAQLFLQNRLTEVQIDALPG
jgi:hypothetical protein